MAVRSLRHAAHFTIDELVALLLPTLGWEKSTELVESTIRQLDLSRDELDEADAIDVFRAMSVHDGLVGVAARFITMRLEKEAKRTSSVPTRIGRSIAPARTARVVAADASITRAELVEKFAPALGSEKGLAVVEAAAEAVGATGDRWSASKALQVVEHLAQAEGLVGIVARFAKAQLLLRVQKV